MHEDLIWCEHAYRYAGVSRRSWRRWELAGQTPQRVAAGRKEYYRLEDLRAWQPPTSITAIPKESTP